MQTEEVAASNQALAAELVKADSSVAELSAGLSATRTRTLHTRTLSEQLTQELLMLQRVQCV